MWIMEMSCFKTAFCFGFLLLLCRSKLMLALFFLAFQPVSEHCLNLVH